GGKPRPDRFDLAAIGKLLSKYDRWVRLASRPLPHQQGVFNARRELPRGHAPLLATFVGVPRSDKTVASNGANDVLIQPPHFTILLRAAEKRQVARAAGH